LKAAVLIQRGTIGRLFKTAAALSYPLPPPTPPTAVSNVLHHTLALELPSNHCGLEESTENKLTINMTVLPKGRRRGSKENDQIVDIGQGDFPL